MTDLTTVLPGFNTQPYIRLLASLEKNHVTTVDLLTLNCIEIAKRASLPILDLKRLSKDILVALQGDLGSREVEDGAQTKPAPLRTSGANLVASWSTISTLDIGLDSALEGGIPRGYVTEITGESGAGKTQFLLHLLLSAQLPPPRGLSGAVLYVSTESPLPTSRLSQLLETHPVLASADPKPTLDAVISIVTSDLESQDHILRFQVPVAIRRYGIKLLILDSVAANYRAEFERHSVGSGQNSGANMAHRSSELVKLGQLLRNLAREENIAIVVANQVADRFSTVAANSPAFNRTTQSSPLARRGYNGGLPSSSLVPPMSSALQAEEPDFLPPTSTPYTGTSDPMALDHQQRWFTGWGDEPRPSYTALQNMKTPSLGLVWTTQIACRIALIKKPVYGSGIAADEDNERGEPVIRKWRRWMKVVFAPHAASSGPGIEGAVEFEIRGEGLRSVNGKDNDGDETAELLS